MKLVLSRKGFDTTSGGGPSPIIAGRPVSLPIPARDRSEATYEALGLGEQVVAASRGRIAATDMCHDDPMFGGGRCWFGQHGSAQGHLMRQGVGPGDVFLFFGLFAEHPGGKLHHRIFGYLRVEAIGDPQRIGKAGCTLPPPRSHPHLIGSWGVNNCLYTGPGAIARRAPPILRLTSGDGPLNLWTVPDWLKGRGLSYHSDPKRWHGRVRLDTVRRGQEFVCDLGRSSRARTWVNEVIAAIES